jgi:oxygen-dependent protoporphyrinogen oxidase
MSGPDLQAVVVGAGVAGLAAALELSGRGRETLLLDAEDRPGGVMRSDSADGFLFERGPNTIMVKGPALALLQRHGLEAALQPARPAARNRYLFHDGQLMPVPMNPLAFATSPMLTGRGKLRLLGEPFVRRGDGGGESVAEFIGRRLGPEAVERLVGPFLIGIYAGDERRLGAETVFSSLVEMERESGSIVRGALARMIHPRGERGLRGSFSSSNGLGGLAGHMARGIGEALHLRTRVASIRREGGSWIVGIESEGAQREIRTRALVLATDAASAAVLLRGVDAEAAAALDAIEYAPVASVPLSIDPSDSRHPIQGFGFLVPRAAGLDLLGALFMSRMFPRRAPEGRELVMGMIGGARWPAVVDAADDEILERVHRGLDRVLGLRAAPQALAITRWPRAVPQPGPHHTRLVRDLRARLAGQPGLALAGAYLEGVSVADTLASGVRAAGEIARL